MVITTKSNKLIITLSFLLLIITTFTTSYSYAANITVTTSRNPVALDDSFHLIYEADSNVDGEPDFNPIYEHFDILNSGQSTNMRYINGNYSLKKSWDLAIIAKDIGKFTIPPIAFGKDSSPAIRITVTNSSSPDRVSPDGQSSVPAKIFLESTLDKKQGWVQSQFIYTLRLLRTVSIASASLTEPKTNDPDAIIQALDENNYQTTRNDVRYEVIERRYVIFPQKSGLLKVEPATFEGRINATQARTIFDQFRMSGQLKRLRSNAVEATVKSAPTTVNLQDWLPARQIAITEEWSEDIQNIKAGEPITRTLTISAEGLTGTQLPDLHFSDINGLKQYPDKAIIEDIKTTTGITGNKQIKIALIPAKAGDYTLPEITLAWWNTKTNKAEVAVVPEILISVAANAQMNNPVINTIDTSEKPITNKSTSEQQALSNENTPQEPTALSSLEPYWKWIALLFAFAWLLTLFLLFKNKNTIQTSDKNKTKQQSTASLKVVTNAVQKNADNNNAAKTKTALITWAKEYYQESNITNLTQITERCSSQLKSEIRHLNETLYSTNSESWTGKELSEAFKSESSLSANNKQKKSSVLKPLYRN